MTATIKQRRTTTDFKGPDQSSAICVSIGLQAWAPKGAYLHALDSKDFSG
jgi:hypothetical protein